MARPLHVEEKLDGFNISIARDETGWPVAFARSGKTAHDRGRQLGRIRAFVGSHVEELAECFVEWPVVYAEWMMRQHSVEYDELPSWLVVLDLWAVDRGFAALADRDRICSAAGLVTPPELHDGLVHNEAALEKLCMGSRFGTGRAEGVVLRDVSLVGAGPVAKWLAPWFRRVADVEMRPERQNHLRSGA